MLEDLFEPMFGKYYPENIYMEIYRNKPYSSRSPYKIYRVLYLKEGELYPIPDKVLLSIVNLIHRLNMDKVYWRNKIGKDISWYDFIKKIREFYLVTRAELERKLQEAGIKAQIYAPLIVPLLYNMEDPVFDKDTYKLENLPGKFMKTIKPGTSGSGRKRRRKVL